MMLVIQDWDVYAFILSFLGVIISLIFYLLYKIFQEPILLQVSKEEMNYAITTVLLVVIVIGLVGTSWLTTSMENMTQAMYKDFNLNVKTTNSGQNVQPKLDSPADLTINMIETIKDKYLNSKIINLIYWTGWPAYVLSTFSEDLYMTEVQSGGGWRPVAEMLSNIYKMTAFYTWVFYIIIQILNFIKYFWGVIFTLGIVLRAFQPTRGAGAYLIALALGLYFIFPLSYLIGEYTALTFVGYYINEPGANPQSAIPSTTIFTGTQPAMSVSPSWMYTVKNRASSPGYIKKLFNYFDFYRHIGPLLYSTLCILPMVALVITLTFVLSTTSLFGGNIPEVGRGLIRLI